MQHDHAEKINNNFSRRDFYSLSDLGNMLSNIGLDVLIIAHQKMDYKAQNQGSNNLSASGQKFFYKMIDIEFFDSLEVQSSKVEGILKNRFIQDKLAEQTITSGSDCHDWFVYPKHDEKSKNYPLLMTIKSLPTFRGLVMAMTNTKRFFTEVPQKRIPLLEKIDYFENGTPNSIELSYGINAIIGDNSVGKSTLINLILNKAANGAIEFYRNHGIEIKEVNISESDYTFNGQGVIREKFEKNEAKSSIQEDFKRQFKIIDLSNYKNIISKIFQKFADLWNYNEEIYINDGKLARDLLISSYNRNNSFFISLNTNISLKENNYNGITKSSYQILQSIINYRNNFDNLFDQTDKKKLEDILNQITEIKNKYFKKELKIIFNNKVVNCFNTVCMNYNNKTQSRKSTEEAEYSDFLDEKQKMLKCILEKIKFKFTSSPDPFQEFTPFNIETLKNKIGDYYFITKPTNNIIINKEIIIEFIKSKIDVENIFTATKSEILSGIRNKKFNLKSMLILIN